MFFFDIKLDGDTMKRIFVFICLIGITLFSINVSAINGSSYCMIEVNSKRILSSNNANQKSLVASTAKIMTALVAINNADLLSYIDITKEDELMEGSKIYVEENDKILCLDLIYGLMLRSGNDAANALSRSTFGDHHKFVEEMNETAKQIGMYNSSFANASGLDSEDYNLSTAYDMCLLMSEAIKNDVFKTITKTKSHRATSFNNKAYYWGNKHKLITSDSRFIGGKTGYTKKAGRILVSYAVENNMEVVIVTINDSNDWNTHRNLLSQTKKYSNDIIIKKGIYNSGFDIDYYIYVEENVMLPLDSDERKYIKAIFQVSDNLCKLKILYKDEIISTREIKMVNKYKYNNLDLIKDLLI